VFPKSQAPRGPWPLLAIIPFSGISADTTTILREPLYCPRITKAEPQQQFLVPNLLLNTLAPFPTDHFNQDFPTPPRATIQQPDQYRSLNVAELARPFVQSDYPNPQPKRDIQRWENPPNLTQEIASPFRQSDWPNPGKGPFQETWWIQDLLQQTLAPTGAAPFNQTDWSIPRAVTRLPVGDPQNLLETTLAPSGPKPFNQSDWVTPKRAVPQQPDIPTDITPILDAANPILVFREASFAPVFKPQYRVDQGSPNLLGTTLKPASGGGAPFNQDDWPIPYKKWLQQQDQPPNLLGTTLGPAVTPAWNDTGDTSRLRANPQQEPPPNLLTTTLSGPAVPPPVRNTDWPTPKPRFVQQPELIPNLQTSTFVPVAPLPFGLSDWPNPKPRFVQQPFDPPNLLGDTLALKPPLGLTDWPVPKPRLTLLTDPPNLLTGGLGPAPAPPPIEPREWQILYPRIVQQQGLIPNLLTGTLAPPPAPAGAAIWIWWSDYRGIVWVLDPESRLVLVDSTGAAWFVLPPVIDFFPVDQTLTTWLIGVDSHSWVIPFTILTWYDVDPTPKGDR
jgi:hypothetical protein